jgi:ferrous iron transporter FeoB
MPESIEAMTNAASGIESNLGVAAVALAGNPNTGKSTVFNSLTGLNQHTGNWPGKTVANAAGSYIHNCHDFMIVDLPGTYSLFSNSPDEEAARDYICSGEPLVTVVVTDATCLERNLNLVFQVMEITSNVVLCVNLLDEARRKKIKINLAALSTILGIPVIGTNARDGAGLEALKDAIYQVALGLWKTAPLQIDYGDAIEQSIKTLEPYLKSVLKKNVSPRWAALRLIEGDQNMESLVIGYPCPVSLQTAGIASVLSTVRQVLSNSHLSGDALRDHIVTSIVKMSEGIVQKVSSCEKHDYNFMDRRIDSILTSKIWGIPVMLLLLCMVFWITIKGANYPSQALAVGLFWIEERLTQLFEYAGWPQWLHGLLVLGTYRTVAWVISVMLPPMAIFFPLFTLLEDLGYLPRIAFNLDNFFKKACAHGKQALTMCMGFGCNAAGVVSCRIIDSPRERLIAIITNNFVPCNGRFPTLISLAAVFIAGSASSCQSAIASLSILAAILLGVFTTLTTSKLLSRTILKGIPSSFTLELPPYRKPQLGKIMIHSLYDRTLFVLVRAISVAAPAGMITWLFANLHIGGISILQHGANILSPFARAIGLDGFILMAFILGFPANEIVIPILIMSYMSAGHMVELNNLQSLRELFLANGWTWLTAVCMMLFCLNHFPCGTTMLTIKKETQSWEWALLTFAVTTAVGITLCFIVAQTVRFLGLV